MKKLLILLFIIFPFISNAGNDFSYSSADVELSFEQQYGLVYVTFKEWKDNGGCFADLRNNGTNTVRVQIKKDSEGWVEIYNNFAGTNGYTTSANYEDFTVPSYRKRRITFNNIDSKYFSGNISVRVLGYWYIYGVSGGNEVPCSGNPSFSIDYTQTVQVTPPNVSNVSSTLDAHCDKVRITWTDPNNWTNRRTDIYRDGNHLAHISNSTTTSYDDLSATPGVKYNYEVESSTHFTNVAPTRIVSAARVAVEGRRVGPKGPATGLFLDQANCSGHIGVNWNWSDPSNPDNFVVERSASPTFSNITTYTVSGSDRVYRDRGASSGNTYYYRIFSAQTCPGTSTLIKSAPTATDSVVGLGVPAAPTVTGLSVDTIGKAITVTWLDNSGMEDGFKIVRQSSSNQVEYDAPANTTSFVDNLAGICDNYTYKVKSYNTCKTAGVLSANDSSAYIPADVLTTFNTGNNKLEATDGEFGDRIDLKWKTNNNQNEDWIITRIDPVAHDTTQVASLTAGTKFFSDVSSKANTLYKYIVQGQLNCAGNIVNSNTTEDIGFRLAYGTVNGQITYTGGVAVKGVKVTAVAASGASGTSGSFNGTSSFATVNNDISMQSDQFSVLAYVKPSNLTGKKPVLSKIAGADGWNFHLEGTELKLTFGPYVYSANSPQITTGTWLAVGAIVTSDSVKLYLNGRKIGATYHTLSSANRNSNGNLLIGKGGADYFGGNIDEVKYYNRAISDLEMQRTYDVYVNPSSNGLLGYWRFDENFGTRAYDYSKKLLSPNKNHATLTNVTWSNSKPSTSQLTAGAYTDSLGSYFIPFIPYLGTGDNYTITPEFGTHAFSPATTTLLIGSGSANYNGQNFTDNSSFTVSGIAKYEGTSCFVKDARLKIDGEVVVKNGEIAMTDAQGQFTIQVPIGPHVVSIEKTSHGFKAGRFPSTGSHDFQQNVTGINFIDSTLVKVVGRVAGGGIQKDLPPGLGRGLNNIGITIIPFRAQQGNGCLLDTVVTSGITGEYGIELPPLRYEIPNFSPQYNLGIQFNNNALLDISQVPPVQMSRDSVFSDSLGFKRLIRVDSVAFQKQRDFIHYVSPRIDVMGKELATRYGADTIEIEDAGTKVKIPTTALGGIPHPVFNENKNYTWLITAFEIYENKDGSSVVLDSVPMVEGKILVQNTLASEVRTEFEYKLTDTVRFSGIQEYKFAAGQANTSIDGLNPSNNFTKTCEITLLPVASSSVSWKPNGEFFRGIIFGGRALGSSFSTAGPDVVTMILRDPPGSGSSASWSSGTTVTTTKSWENGGGLGLSLQKDIALGTEFTVGLGYSTKTEISNNLNLNTQIETNINEQGEIVENITTSVAISTGTGDEFVGGGADLFFGRAMNMDFGLSQILTLIDVNKCGANADCYGAPIPFNGKNYKLGTTNSMFAVPKGYETEFVFTQTGIENSVIPKLYALRNQFLTTDPRYTSYLTASHANFGLSNDDPEFGLQATPDPEISGAADSLGLSYYFRGYRTVDTTMTDTLSEFPLLTQQRSFRVTLGVDSVWWYNKQIRLWEDALAQNEKAKVQSIVPERNISYQGGSTITYTNTSERTESSTTAISFNLSEVMTLKIGAKIGGAGVKIEQGATLNYTHGTNFGNATTTTTSFEYSISDPDGNDEFSVDVFKPKDGFGPVFKTRGGQTSCPYQGQTVTKYYQPGTELDKATIQLDQPRITAVPSTLFNIPADGQGNITLNLINDGLKDAIYSLKVLESTNPNGLIMEVDGLNPNRDFGIPAQTSITKTLTLRKGPFYIAYDSIALVLHSRCQYAFGTANYKDIADTVYISVNFLPSCTDLDVQAPQNQFIANNSFNNLLPVVISGYDINYGGLEKIQLQYKPSNQASWVPLGREWFKDTSNIFARYPNHVDPQQIPRGQSYIAYQLEMDQLIDQDYDLRAVSTCLIPQNPRFDQESGVISGIFDRVNPHPFGSPTPADGVLDPNDDISIQFNEVIEAGSLTPDNFQITGVLNGQELRHDVAVAFNGANGYMEIDNGFDFASGSFTIEFWAKRAVLGGTQTVISQGVNANNTFWIGFNPNNELAVKIGAHDYTSNFTILDDSLWHHYTITYDKNSLTIEITERNASAMQTSTNNNYFASYTGAGKTYIGKNALNNADFFNGSIHQFRIWNRVLTPGQVSSRININLHGREAGLIGFWPMDEGRGTLAEDISRFRHAELFTGWELNPKSTAGNFNGIDEYVVADTAGSLAMTQEMDMSIEFWFRTSGGRLQTLLSNGAGRFTTGDVNRNGWNVEMNASNEIWVKNDSFAFKAVENNFADNQWHHFALVVNRLANTTAYIDGAQQKSTSSSNFWGFGAAKLAIGAMYYNDGVNDHFSQYFAGQLDEVRIWNSALLRDNIELNRYNRLKGNEFGLLAYYPFESYRLELGVPVLDVSLANQSSVLAYPTKLNAHPVNGTIYTNESPAVALQRPVEQIKFGWSVNNDKIVITPNEDPANIENVTLNVSVKGVKDLHGNVMQSPKTWIAFVNKNQVIWQDASKNLSKEFNDTMTFTTRVVNSGGEVKNFTISNIPPWLTVSPSSGTIQPLSTKLIHFTVNPAVNIGNYSEDLLLTTDFGFNEKFLVNLKVRKTAPSFNFDPSQFAKSMSVIGQIRINGNVSVNPEDMLIAFINDSVRGKANLQYVNTYDKYVAFLDIYSNASDSITFKVWNASNGELHDEVIPDLYFVENDLVGSPSNPQYFDAEDRLAKPIALRRGWNWVSFPLKNEKMSSIHNFMEGLNFQNGDVIKTRGNNAQAVYGGSQYGWSGGLVNEGILNTKSYLVHISNPDTIDYNGLVLDPDTIPISVVTGWNLIGFVSIGNISVNTALANFNASDGDLIKSQQRFAYFDQNLGWIGSLTAMEPLKGYLLKSSSTNTFTFPRQGLLRMKEVNEQPDIRTLVAAEFDFDPNEFEASTNVIAQINTCDEIIENEDWILAAFKGEELRGWSEAGIKVSPEQTAAYYLTIYGEHEDDFDLMLYNIQDKSKLMVNGTVAFVNNTLQGTPQQPREFELFIAQDCDLYKTIEAGDNFAQGSTYPNPFSDKLNLVIPKEIGDFAQIEISDVHGKILNRFPSNGQREIPLKSRIISHMVPGIYLVTYRDEQNVVLEKLVKVD